MKRIVNAFGKLNWGKRAYAVFACAQRRRLPCLRRLSPRCSASMARTANTPMRGWSRPPMGTSTGQRRAGGANYGGHGLQNHPERHADDAIQLLLPKRVHGRRGSPSGLVQATNGDFYGTTGGRGQRPGTVFKITPSGTLTTLYSFCSQSGCTDGEQPRRGAGPGHQWGPLRDNVRWRGQRRRARSSKSPRVAR
jgi:uncharacterized repeat protein (TIGR03803 family)